jgi:hypothetical protein
MKIIKHSIDSGMCGGIILKYVKGVHADQFCCPSTVHVQWVPGHLFLGLYWPGHEIDHSPPANAEDTPTSCNMPTWCGHRQLYVFLGSLKE